MIKIKDMLRTVASLLSPRQESTIKHAGTCSASYHSSTPPGYRPNIQFVYEEDENSEGWCEDDLSGVQRSSIIYLQGK